MDKEIQHNGHVYRIETTPKNRHGTAYMFAHITELVPQQQFSVLAQWLAEETGHPSYSYVEFVIPQDELVQLVLELGHDLSPSTAWHRLCEWADTHRKAAPEPARGCPSTAQVPDGGR